MKLRKFIIIFTIFNLLISCGLQITDDGFLDSSINSSVSKKNGVFIDYYDVEPNFVTTLEGKKLRIAEAFIEYKYNIKHSGEVIKWDGTQMVLRLKDEIPDTYNLDWNLNWDYHFTQGTGDFMLHTDMECAPDENVNSVWNCLNRLDTINIQIRKIDEKDSLKAIIGHLKFIKRK